MYKTLDEIDMNKIMRVITAAYDEGTQIRNPDELIGHLAQFSNELSEVSEGLSEEDALLVHHKAFETLEKFQKEPKLRQLFK